MRLSLLLSVAFLCCIAATDAKAQIGYTPEQMEAKYGKPWVWTAGAMEHSVEARYKLDPKRNDVMASLGVTNLNITFIDGTVQSIALNNPKDLTAAMVALGTAIVDEHPNVSKAANAQAFSKGVILMVDYKGYRITAMTTGGFIVERSELAVNAAKMGVPMNNPEISASTQKQADSFAKALRKK